jgi:hypothetical protein
VFSGLTGMLPPLAVPELLLTSSSLRPTGFDLFKPLLKRFPSEENTPTDPYTRQMWDAWNLVMDNVEEMRSRTPHKRGSLGEVQNSSGSLQDMVKRMDNSWL